MIEEKKSTAQVFQPATLDELDELVERTNGRLTYVAGATDLMVQQEKWNAANALVDLAHLSEISDWVEIKDSGVFIGAAVPLDRLIDHPLVQKKFPILVEACRQIGSRQIQNRATLGGNIANASPAGDSMPVLSVLNADILTGPKQNGKYRRFKLEEMMLGPGEIRLKKNHYIAHIFIPFLPVENYYWAFRKVGQRYALTISKLNLAVLGWGKRKLVEEVRICAGSVAPKIERARKTENLLRGKKLSEKLIGSAMASIQEEISPIDDIRSTKFYRQRITGEVLREVLYRWMEWGE